MHARLLAAAVFVLALAVPGTAMVADASTQKPSSPNALSVVDVLGPRVSVPAGKFVRAYMCPKGYYVTGGGAYNGAITEIVSGPTVTHNGWFVDGVNNDLKKRSFTHNADAVCVKGTSAVPIAAIAAGPATVRQAERDYLAAHGGGADQAATDGGGGKTRQGRRRGQDPPRAADGAIPATDGGGGNTRHGRRRGQHPPGAAEGAIPATDGGGGNTRHGRRRG